jgi:hypothetical protein
MKYRSNIAKYSEFVFRDVDPDFPRNCQANRERRLASITHLLQLAARSVRNWLIPHEAIPPSSKSWCHAKFEYIENIPCVFPSRVFMMVTQERRLVRSHADQRFPNLSAHRG